MAHLLKRVESIVMWKVDLHTHTIASSDCLVSPEDYVAACRRAGLDKVAITEHNNLDSAQRLLELDPDLMIVGEEIKTSAGEFIAYFVREAVPKGLPPQEALNRLRAQGAVISISHPLDGSRATSAMGLQNTLRFLDQVDALEGFNARCARAVDNLRTQELARQHGKLLTAGSDAHTTLELGRAYLLMPPFDDAASFLHSLAQAQIGGQLSGYHVHFSSTYAKLYKSVRKRLH